MSDSCSARKLEAGFDGRYLMSSVLMTSTMKSEPATPPMRGNSFGVAVSATERAWWAAAPTAAAGLSHELARPRSRLSLSVRGPWSQHRLPQQPPGSRVGSPQDALALVFSYHVPSGSPLFSGAAIVQPSHRNGSSDIIVADSAREGAVDVLFAR